MKSIFIAYNQAYHPLILRLLKKHNVKGYTAFHEVQGEGSRDGEPHLGSHAWPTMNSALLVICSKEKVTPLLSALKDLDENTPEQGLRAFVWSIEDAI